PTLSLIYLPHLDYNLQRLGPSVAAADVRRRDGGYELTPAILPDLRAIDVIVGDLIDFFATQSVHVILVSEYGITPVNWPVHLNRVFRREGWLAVKDELGREILDCGASKVFAVADHQIAHIYQNDLSLERRVRGLRENQEGVEQVLGESERAPLGL